MSSTPLPKEEGQDDDPGASRGGQVALTKEEGRGGKIYLKNKFGP